MIPNAPQPTTTHSAAPAPFDGAVKVPHQRPDKLLRLPRVEEMTALKKSTIYALMRDERNDAFPKPVRLGCGRSVAWRESEVQAWIAARPKTGGAND